MSAFDEFLKGYAGDAPPAPEELPDDIPDIDKDYAAKHKRASVYYPIIDRFAKDHPDVPDLANYAKAMMLRESGGNPTATSSAGAKGLMQVTPPTYEDMGGDPNNAYDPVDNIKRGVQYIADQYRDYGDWKSALAAYNWGPRNVDRHGTSALPPETDNYVKAVNAYRKRLKPSGLEFLADDANQAAQPTVGQGEAWTQFLQGYNQQQPSLDGFTPKSIDVNQPQPVAKGLPALAPAKTVSGVEPLPPEQAPIPFAQVAPRMGQYQAPQGGLLSPKTLNAAQVQGNTPMARPNVVESEIPGPVQSALDPFKGLTQGFAGAVTAKAYEPPKAENWRQAVTQFLGDLAGQTAVQIPPFFLGPEVGLPAAGSYQMLRSGNEQKNANPNRPVDVAEAGAQGGMGAALAGTGPSFGKEILKRVLTGAGIGMAQGEASSAIDQLAEQGKIDLNNPATWKSALISAGMGAIFGAAHRSGEVRTGKAPYQGDGVPITEDMVNRYTQENPDANNPAQASMALPPPEASSRAAALSDAAWQAKGEGVFNNVNDEQLKAFEGTMGKTVDAALQQKGAKLRYEVENPAPDQQATEPYQMTRAKYEALNAAMGPEVAQAAAPHIDLVKDAVAQGKPVPPEVMAEYPHLAPPETAPDASNIIQVGEYVRKSLQDGRTFRLNPQDAKRLGLYEGQASNPDAMAQSDLVRNLGTFVKVDPNAPTLDQIAHNLNKQILVHRPGEDTFIDPKYRFLGADKPADNYGFNADDLATALLNRPRGRDALREELNTVAGANKPVGDYDAAEAEAFYRLSPEDRARHEAEMAAAHQNEPPPPEDDELPYYQRDRTLATETPQFKNWFGESRVRDENGQPKAVYHGTVADFNAFDKSERGVQTQAPSARAAFFFTDHPGLASDYSSVDMDRPTLLAKKGRDAASKAWLEEWQKGAHKDPAKTEALFEKLNEAEKRYKDAQQKQSFGASYNNWESAPEGANVVPAYLRMENPLEIDYKGHEYRETSFREAINTARKNGNDGVIFRNARDGVYNGNDPSSTIYAVFEPHQIKSSIGNRGTFDPNSHNILEQSHRGSFKYDAKAGEYVISLVKGKANLSTLFHEHFHLLEQMGAIDKADHGRLAAILEQQGIKDPVNLKTGTFKRAAAEKLANWFERYLHDGATPVAGLRPIFDKIKMWMRQIYRSVKGTPLEDAVPGEVRGIYDRMFKAGETEDSRLVLSDAFKGLSKEMADTQPPEEPAGKPVELQAVVIPGLKEFIEQDAAPATKETAQAFKDLLGDLAKVLSPRVGTRMDALDLVYRMKGDREKAMFTMEQGMRSIKKMFINMGDEASIDFIDRVKRGEKQPTQKLQDIADLYRHLDDEIFKQIILYKPTLAYKEGHFRLFYSNSKILESNPKLKASLEGGKGFLKRAIFPDLSAALEAGLKPISLNPQVLFEKSQADALRYISAQRMWGSLKEKGLAKFVKTGDPHPEGYVRLDDKVARVYFKGPKDALEKTGEYYVESNVARILNNYLSEDWLRSRAYGRGLLAIKNLTTGIELSISPFHFMFETLDAVASKFGMGLTRLVNEGDLRGLKDMVTAPAAPYEFAKAGGRALKYFGDKAEFLKATGGQKFIKQFPEADRLMDDLFMGGGKLAMHEDYKINTIDTFKQNLNSHNYIGAALRAFPAFNELLMKPLFEIYIPRLKIGLFLNEMSQQLSQHAEPLAKGQVSRGKIARDTWDRVENRFGEMNFDNLFWNRTFKTAMQIMFRSVTWKLGSIRGMGTAAWNQSKLLMESASILKDAEGQRGFKRPTLDPSAAWMMGVLSTTAVLSTIIQKGFTGQWPQQPIDFMFPKDGTKDKNGNENRVSLPTYLRDAFSFKHNPITYVAHSGSGLISHLFDVLQNRDFYGDFVFDPDGSMASKTWDIVKYMLPKPFSATQLTQALQSTGPAANKALGFVGVNKAPKEYIQTPFQEELAKSFERQVGFKPKTPEQKELKQEKKDYLQKLTHGKASGNDILDAMGKGLVKPKSAARDAKLSGLTPMEYMWKMLSKDEKMRLDPLMSNEERKVLMWPKMPPMPKLPMPGQKQAAPRT